MQKKEGGAMSTGLFHKILVADDGSPDGERAASVAVELAAKLKAEVILLGVVEPANVQAEGEGLPLDDPSSYRRLMEIRFERFLNTGKLLGIPMMMEIVEGDPVQQIRQRAIADRADLIVVGRRSLSGVRRWFQGSTAEALLRESGCSVLVAR
jgi:nucleotide-binding universal stress UspA family protein